MNRKGAKKGVALVYGTKTPVARCLVNVFNDITNFEIADKNKATRKLHKVTERSSKNNGTINVQTRSSILPVVAELPPKFTASEIIQYKFTRASSVSHFSFTGSSQHVIVKSPLDNKLFNSRSTSGIRNVAGVPFDDHQGLSVNIPRNTRLQRHQQMFKSRYAKRRRAADATLVGRIRMNRRFDLQMKHREDQMAAERDTKQSEKINWRI